MLLIAAYKELQGTLSITAIERQSMQLNYVFLVPKINTPQVAFPDAL